MDPPRLNFVTMVSTFVFFWGPVMLYQVGKFGFAGIIICAYCLVEQINLPLIKTLLFNVISGENYYLLLILLELSCGLG